MAVLLLVFDIYIYIPIDCLGYWLDGVSLIKAMVLEARGFFLLGEGRLSWPLWYLLASVVGFILVYIMLRKGMSSRNILGISFLFLLGGFGLSLLLKWGLLLRSLYPSRSTR